MITPLEATQDTLRRIVHTLESVLTLTNRHADQYQSQGGHLRGVSEGLTLAIEVAKREQETTERMYAPKGQTAEEYMFMRLHTPSMKMDRNLVPESDIATFALDNGLTMVVNERRDSAPKDRFYASFKGCEVMEDGFLVGGCGNGPTESDAIADYARTISMKRLAVDAYTDARRNIDVPRLHTPVRKA